jgi:hypothetical protein
MGLHYNGGSGFLHDKELEKPIADIQYQLIETDATKYAAKKWWGGFSTKREVKKLGNYMIEFDDGRQGDCVIFSGDELPKGTRPSRRYQYRFYGRGRLRGDRLGGRY